MRLPAVFLVAWLTAAVAGLGMRVGYEKIMLYYAWRIDQLMPEAQRVIAVSCTIPLPPRNYGVCPVPPVTNPPTPRYKTCRWTDLQYVQGTGNVRTVRDCTTFNHFMKFIDEDDYLRVNFHGRGTPMDQVDFDVDATAREINRRGADQRQITPWRYYKDSVSVDVRNRDGEGSYGGFLDSVFDRMAHVKRTIPQATYDTNKGIFDKLEISRRLLTRARQADGDYHFMKYLKTENPNLEIKSFGLGYQDGPDDERRQASLFLWSETFEANKHLNFLDDEYRYARQRFEGTARRREHKIVIDNLVDGGERVRMTCR